MHRMQIVIRIDVAVERELLAGRVPNVIREVEVRAMGAAVRVHLPARHAERRHRAVMQAEIKMPVRVFLDWEPVVLEKGEVLDELRRFVEIDENADPATLRRGENGAEKPDEIKRRKLAVFRMEQDVFAQVVGEGGFGV